MSTSATEAAFEGFRVTRSRPGAVLLWAGVWLVGLIAMILLLVPLVGPWIEEIGATGGDAARLSPEAAAGLQRATLAFIPVLLVLQGLLSAAVYRVVLRPEEKALGSLRLGRDEGRVLVVGVLTGLLSASANFGGEWLVRAAMGAAGPLVATGLSLLLTAGLVALAVRLSLIAPLTFLKRRFAFREGWTASGRLFWPLLGMTIIVITLALVVVLLLIIVGWPMQSVLTAPAGAASPGAAVGALLMLLLIPLGMALVTTITWAPFAAISRDLPEGKLVKG
ncbi:MAG: hypothetical protein ACK4JY_04000 [Brevundimonas sp.]|uniref:hypothetical protein n=1 Tax=Brevundimonas sp. TaxID=1871086 RepID=UPI00391BFA71